jgi:hypothetical protein
MVLVLSGSTDVAAAKPAPRAVPLTQKQATVRIAALPEVVGWSAYAREHSRNRRMVGAVPVDDPGHPTIRDGVAYWRIDCLEMGTSKDRDNPSSHRRETFLVRVRDGGIFVEDLLEDSILSLARWRVLQGEQGARPQEDP